MDQQSWNVVNAAISAFGVIAGGVAAWAAMRVYRKQIEGEFPTVSASFEGGQLVIRVENTTGIVWMIDRLSIPSKTRGNLDYRFSEYDEQGNLKPLKDDEAEEIMLDSSIPVGQTLQPSGVSAASYGGRADITWVRVHLRTSRRTLSMRLILLSSDALQRKKVIVIKRQAPASIMIAAD